jgi:type I restriction-modification system DNA methylase subunit
MNNIKQLEDKMLKFYLKNIYEMIQRGDAREESFYSVLEELLNKYSESINKRDIKITTSPKQTEAGNPDFRIWDGKQHIVGYIEAKKPGTNLDEIEISEQLKRYKSTFPNLILTNFLEFRLYRNGKLVDKISLCRPFIIYQLNIIPPLENKEQFLRLLESFFSFSLPKIYNAETLAIELAKRTRFLKDEVIEEELKEEENNKPGIILGFYEAFQEYLIKGLSHKDFADLYSQTITYGLFAARTRSTGEFNRKLAYDNIPQTIGILRDVFEFISIGNLPLQMEWTIDDISEVLAVTDVKTILLQYFHEGKGKDPIIHFYETFLAEYDPQTREKRGVYYTPEPVVSYIVRSLNFILKEYFNKPDGFADKSVTILDPAAGTLTFLAEAAKLALQEFVSKYGEGARESFIKEQILQNFYAFELMMAPYAIGHLKMSFLLEELGYKLKEDERFKFYLTNTLEMEELDQTNLPGMASLSKESHLAGKVKKEEPILVILGNPPYSVSSANKSEFIEKEMTIYKEDVRSERNIQPLSDDYIKFIRFAHWKIDKSGKGVIGMITNNSYLSGLIHRGMRKKLLQSFNEIYILNLHGNSRIGEKCPDGSKDENVFDIMQGVSIALFIKNKEQEALRKVYYQDVYGLRENKYDFLNNNNIKTIEWKELKLSEPYYFFVEKDFSLQAHYDKFFPVSEIFNKFSSGVKTHRDHFVVGFNEEEIKQRMRTFTSDLPDDLVKQALNLKDTNDWKINIARDKIKKENWVKSIFSYSYRPFDIRYICYHKELIDRNRIEIMQNFFYENLGLALMRNPIPGNLTQILISKNIVDINFYAYQSYLFPLYIYSHLDKKDLFNYKKEREERESNINCKLLKILSDTYKNQPSSEEIFYYIYAILYSNIYREKYAEFLKIDFPRIPFTKNYNLFKEMAEFGKGLVDLHLFNSTELDPPLCKFQGQGDNRIEKIKYEETEKRIHFNEKQYFEGIPQDIWQYQIGSYQVCRKWLKDRKGRCLSLEDVKHYCRMVTALQKTIEIQKEIDNIYEKVERNIIEVK